MIDRFGNELPSPETLTEERLDQLMRAAVNPGGSEDDMFCAKHVPALVEALREARS